VNGIEGYLPPLQEQLGGLSMRLAEPTTKTQNDILEHKVSVEKVSQLELTLCEPQNFSKTLSLFYD
jgi:hypothetical protein